MTIGLFVEPAALQGQLESGSVLAVDVRQPYFYGQGHLPGAVNLSVVSLHTAGGTPLPVEALAELLGSRGVRRDTHLVLYDDGASPSAAYLFWLLDYYGHPAASILNGGITRWRREGREVTYGPEELLTQHYVAAPGHPHAMAQLDDVRTAVGAPDTVIIDVRSPAEYLGLQASAARDGHIPTAINIDWTNNLERGNNGVAQLKSEEELRLLYSTAGVSDDKHVVVYCQSGNRSSMTYSVLKYLGYPHVSNYIGSWQEWGNRDDTPVEPE